jgi:hypothetical protein
MFAKHRWVYLLVVGITPLSGNVAQDRQTFSLPDSVLLFGIYSDLRVVTPDRVLEIKPPVEVGGTNRGYFVYPGLAPRGHLVAWGFVVDWQKDRPRYSARFALGVYSIKEQKWKTYGDFDNIGTPAFSPDGSKIAFVARDPIKGYHMLMFDVATEKLTTMTNVNVEDFRGKGGIPQKATLGWSPDGKRLVVELERTDKTSLIAVVDPSTGEVKPLGEGTYPAWSPAGEWIAYYDPPGERCMLVHPDGTGTKLARKVHSTFFSRRGYGYAAVWSPVGKKLLLNEVNEDRAVWVVLLDLETGRSTTRKTENGLAAFGWVSSRK